MKFDYFAPRSRKRPRGAIPVGRRGYRAGWVVPRAHRSDAADDDEPRRWHGAEPIFLPGIAKAGLPSFRTDIARSRQLYRTVLADGDCSSRLLRAPFRNRLQTKFELLGTVNHENDPQEIITLEFDGLRRGRIDAEDLWCKISWLSFEPGDASLRFRFSFGLVHYENVAADLARQQYSAKLTEALFPESALITRNRRLLSRLRQIVGRPDLAFVERIVYFNAPRGGAEFHQDVERGHLGVVYAQVTGRTFWLALAKEQLIRALRDFSYTPDWAEAVTRLPASGQQLTKVVRNARRCNALLDAHDRNDDLLAIINRTPQWNRYLIEQGHGYLLQPGDALLLPQHDVDRCAWHSVFCPDEQPGEGLSFALRSIA